MTEQFALAEEKKKQQKKWRTKDKRKVNKDAEIYFHFLPLQIRKRQSKGIEQTPVEGVGNCCFRHLINTHRNTY